MKNMVEAISLTRPPGFHWFGYYDKFQFDPADRYALAMRVDFEHRLYTGDDTIRIGMIDLAHDFEWIPLGELRAWSWQQGCGTGVMERIEAPAQGKSRRQQLLPVSCCHRATP